MENLTAKMCLFVKAYHIKKSNIKIYYEKYAKNILGNDYNNIFNNLKNGIDFFEKEYQESEPIKLIVNKYLAPNILARSAFNERFIKKWI